MDMISMALAFAWSFHMEAIGVAPEVTIAIKDQKCMEFQRRLNSELSSLACHILAPGKISKITCVKPEMSLMQM